MCKSLFIQNSFWEQLSRHTDHHCSIKVRTRGPWKIPVFNLELCRFANNSKPMVYVMLALLFTSETNALQDPLQGLSSTWPKE